MSGREKGRAGQRRPVPRPRKIRKGVEMTFSQRGTVVLYSRLTAGPPVGPRAEVRPWRRRGVYLVWMWGPRTQLPRVLHVRTAVTAHDVAQRFVLNGEFPDGAHIGPAFRWGQVR